MKKVLAAIALILLALSAPQPAEAYPPPDTVITVYYGSCSVSFQHGTGPESGAHAAFLPHSGSYCSPATYVQVKGVKQGGSSIKYDTCYLNESGCTVWGVREARAPGHNLVSSRLNLCFWWGVDQYCQAFNFYP